MTACSECLAELSLTRLADIGPNTQVALHVASCGQCGRVAREVAYAERRLATALADMRPSHSPAQVSALALDGSERLRRKYVGRWVRGLLMAAGSVTFWFFMNDVVAPRLEPPSRVVTETLTLHCLSADQASKVVTPYLRSNGSAVYVAKELNAITIRGRADEFGRAKLEIRKRDDDETCNLPVTRRNSDGVDAATSNGTPGKD